MKWLAVNARKSNCASHSKQDHGQNKKRRKSQKFVKNKDQQGGREHYNKLPRSNRPDYFILYINKLWNSELLHSRVTCNL